MTKELGIDYTGTWTAHQYVIDVGYDRYSIEQTAIRGVSEAEIDGLSREQIEAVEAHCRREVRAGKMTMKNTNEYPTETDYICGRPVEHDSSGVGHNWRRISRDKIPADVVEEIECEILDSKRETVSDYVAGNGLHYRW